MNLSSGSNTQPSATLSVGSGTDTLAGGGRSAKTNADPWGRRFNIRISGRFGLGPNIFGTGFGIGRTGRDCLFKSFVKRGDYTCRSAVDICIPAKQRFVVFGGSRIRADGGRENACMPACTGHPELRGERSERTADQQR